MRLFLSRMIVTALLSGALSVVAAAAEAPTPARPAAEASASSGGGAKPLGEIVFKRKDGAAPEVAPSVFSHWFHRIRYKCYACHDAIFEMKAGASPVTMEAILGGKYCGACHNGQVAWASSFDNCNRCHVPK